MIGPLIDRSSCADVVRRYSRGLDAWGCSDRVRWVSSWASSAVLRPDGVHSSPVALSVQAGFGGIEYFEVFRMD